MAALLAALACLLGGALLASAQDEIMYLADPAFASRQRPGVFFMHEKHMDRAECTDCHHFYENGINVWELGMETSCSACHDAADSGRLGLRRAMHGQCMGCHEAQGVASPAAPVMCGECHVPDSGEARP